MENVADSYLVRSRNKGATSCFKTSNDMNYNSKATCTGTSLHSLPDTIKFYSKEFGVNLSYLLPGENTRRCHSIVT